MDVSLWTWILFVSQHSSSRIINTKFSYQKLLRIDSRGRKLSTPTPSTHSVTVPIPIAEMNSPSSSAPSDSMLFHGATWQRPKKDCEG